MIKKNMELYFDESRAKMDRDAQFGRSNCRKCYSKRQNK